MNTIGKASAIALTFLTVTSVCLGQSKYKYTPPKVSAPAPHYSAPKVSAPRATPQRSTPAARSTPQRSSQPASTSRPSSRPSSRQSSTSSQARSQAASQRAASQTQARQQREQAKQQQQKQKEQARQQKVQAKQLEQQKKQQAKQQREQAKQQEKQQKQQEKQQREEAKRQKHSPAAANQTASASHPSTPSTASQPSAPHLGSAAYHVPENGVAGSSGGATTLTKEGSQSVVGQMNSSRAHMSGINARPLPSGDVTVHANGHLMLATAGGQRYELRSNGSISSFHDGQTAASFNQHGMVRAIHTPNLMVMRTRSGNRIILTHVADNGRLVSTGPHAGYMESNIVVGGRPYIQRTAIVNHQLITSRYVGYSYGGVALNGFVAPFYYSPGFYAYAYNPWADPLAYDFGWDGAPWYGGPSPYFGAYAMYPSAAYWLTDYMIGQTLSAAYQIHQEALAGKDADYASDVAGDNGDGSDDAQTVQANASTPISPEIKEQIAEEVKEQIEIDRQNAANKAEEVRHDEVASAASQPNHVFLVGSDLDVMTDDGKYCSLQAGDVLRVVTPLTPGQTAAQLRVASSQRADCPSGASIAVSLENLQDMQNTFHAQVESGLGTMLAHQGDGIPAASLDAVAGKPQPTVDGPAPAKASELMGMLNDQRDQADKAEVQVTASVQ